MSAPSVDTLVNVATAILVVVDILDGPSPDVGAAALAAKAARAERMATAAETGAGKAFTQAQKREIYAANRAKNGGELRSDQSGMRLSPSQKSEQGVPTPKDAAQVDHYVPRSAGGTNDLSNGRVLSAPENRIKSDTMPLLPPPSPPPPTTRWWWPF